MSTVFLARRSVHFKLPLLKEYFSVFYLVRTFVCENIVSAQVKLQLLL